MGRPKGAKNLTPEEKAERETEHKRKREESRAAVAEARLTALQKVGTEKAESAAPKKGGYRYTPEELREKVDAFLERCEARQAPPLLPQMLLYLGISRSTLKRWAETDPAYAEVCEYAQLHREAYLLERMVSDNKLAQGSLNALKQPENGGYVDRPVDTGESKVTINLIGVGGEAAAK